MQVDNSAFGEEFNLVLKYSRSGLISGSGTNFGFDIDQLNSDQYGEFHACVTSAFREEFNLVLKQSDPDYFKTWDLEPDLFHIQ
jgi:hypothetical protein